jgi:glucans biosynthesis protein
MFCNRGNEDKSYRTEKSNPESPSLCISGAVAFASILCVAARCIAADQGPMTFDRLRDQARDLAAHEYKEDKGTDAPEVLKNLSYDRYQDIRFRPDAAPWQKDNLRFRVELFHRGYIYVEPVRIHLIENGQMHDLQFSPDQFLYGTNNTFSKQFPADLGFAGFKLAYTPLVEQRENRVEIGSFIGASYFRFVGVRQRYGSAFRGLAIDTGEPAGEEFPRFKEFWITKPGPEATHLECMALMDSASCAGAYRFVIKPGDDVTADMEASVFIRKAGKKFGLAPLTGMFLYGKNRTSYYPDFRPEIHDCDGLLIGTTNGDWTWRPLVCPPKTHVIHRFPVEGLAGFGLMQRERDFRSYEDLEARYDLRPSLWVQPQGNWGPGIVELVEIPSPNEYHDNIVAYWVPKDKPVAGQELRLSCQLGALLRGPDEGPRARAISTRITPAHDKIPTRFILDFAGDNLPTGPAKQPIEARTQVSNAEIQNLVAQKNEITGGWRVFFDLAKTTREPVEIRVCLQAMGQVVSETWLYHYQPE